MARVNETRNELNLLHRLDLLDEKRFQPKIIVSFLDCIRISFKNPNNLVIMNNHILALISTKLRELVL